MARLSVIEPANKVLTNQRMKRAGKLRSIEGCRNVVAFRKYAGQLRCRVAAIGTRAANENQALLTTEI